MSDIVERLRGRADRYRQLWGNAAYYTEGDALFDEKIADTITTLRADLQKLNERNAEYIGTIDRLRRRVAETDVEIERLSEANTQVWAYNERLRAALEKIEYLDRPQVRGLPRRVSIQEIAAAVLAQEKQP
ncbi:MAG: hypothetical protein [Caudoviricetes sp.]|nr:MAG: hypothetical protein [Caudoviricetes sp.]